ncbi:MAG: hypothetical protein GXP02_08335 [Alphaproteobacteria bacterium]|nr:hypothetical protein [Alphaproteobacteria bacterium]
MEGVIMEAGSGKALFIKLSGVALGLVVTLSTAAVLTRSLNRNSVVVAASGDFVDRNPVANNEITILTDSGQPVVNVGIKATRLAARKTRLEYLGKLVRSRLRVIYALDNAIRRIEKQSAIPATLRQNILINLEQQLEGNQKRLSEIESFQASLSHKIMSSRSSYNPNSAAADMVKKSLPRVRKKSVEARYWI